MALSDGLIAIDKALAMLPAAMDTPQARIMLIAIGLQESGMTHRRQIVDGKPAGPAAGLWQFEAGGGCRGVLTHSASRYWMHDLCQKRGVLPRPAALWSALQSDDVLAAGAARLLLFTDPRRLPAAGDRDGAWVLYQRVWRPGKPHPNRWPDNYRAACSEVAAAL